MRKNQVDSTNRGDTETGLGDGAIGTNGNGKNCYKYDGGIH